MVRVQPGKKMNMVSVWPGKDTQLFLTRISLRLRDPWPILIFNWVQMAYEPCKAIDLGPQTTYF